MLLSAVFHKFVLTSLNVAILALLWKIFESLTVPLFYLCIYLFLELAYRCWSERKQYMSWKTLLSYYKTRHN